MYIAKQKNCEPAIQIKDVNIEIYKSIHNISKQIRYQNDFYNKEKFHTYVLPFKQLKYNSKNYDSYSN